MRNHKNIVVTLQYNKLELTERLVRGLAKHESENIDELIVVDNGSSDPIPFELLGKMLEQVSFPTTVYPIAKNIGFTLGANYGLLQAQNFGNDGNLIFLISNDVQVNGPFINQTEDVLHGAKRSLVSNRHIDWDSGWNTFSGKTFDYLEGYFLAATRFGWHDLGYFDPNYAPCDFEDVDLSTKAKQKGYQLVSLNNPAIYHAGAGTYGYNPEREAITKRNQEYFKNKWLKS